ncbi:MAG: glycosyl hydrolase, partial [Acidimicrobiales bacterium]
IFADVGATNVSWVWTVNSNSSPVAGWNTFKAYYPGNAYVDWVGIDGYNFSKGSGYGCPCSFASIFDPAYAAFQRFAPGKPVIIPETGSAKTGSVKFMAEVRSWARAHPDLKALVWFDTDDNGSFRTDVTPQSEAAFRTLAHDPYFEAKLGH